MNHAVLQLHSKFSTQSLNDETFALWQNILCAQGELLGRDITLVLLEAKRELFSSTPQQLTPGSPCERGKFHNFFFLTVNPTEWLVTYLGAGDQFVAYSALTVLHKILSCSHAYPGIFSAWLGSVIGFLQDSFDSSAASPDQASARCISALECICLLLKSCKQWDDANSSDLLLNQLWSHRHHLWSSPVVLHSITPLEVLDAKLLALSVLLDCLHTSDIQTDTGPCHSGTQNASTLNSGSPSLLFVKWFLADVVPSVCHLTGLLLQEHDNTSSLTGCLDVLKKVVSNSCLDLLSEGTLNSSSELCCILVAILKTTLQYGSWSVAYTTGGSVEQCPFISTAKTSDRRMALHLFLTCLKRLIETEHPEVDTFLKEIVPCGSLLAVLSGRCASCQLLPFLSEDDEDLFEVLSLLQDIYCLQHGEASSAGGNVTCDIDSVLCTFNPTGLLFHLLVAISLDHLVFVDWLVSDETTCLDYFSCYLQVIAEQPDLLLTAFDSEGSSKPSPSVCFASVGSDVTGSEAADPVIAQVVYDLDRNNPFRAAMFSHAPPVNVHSLPPSTATAAPKSLVSYGDSSGDEEEDRCEDQAPASRRNTSDVSHSSAPHPAEAMDVDEDGASPSSASKSVVPTADQDAPCSCHVTRDDFLTFVVRLRLLVERLDRHDLLPFTSGQLLPPLTLLESCLEENSRDSLASMSAWDSASSG